MSSPATRVCLLCAVSASSASLRFSGSRLRFPANRPGPAVLACGFSGKTMRNLVIVGSGCAGNTAAVTAGFVYVMRATPIYSSASKLYVEQSGPKIMEEMQGIMTVILARWAWILARYTWTKPSCSKKPLEGGKRKAKP